MISGYPGSGYPGSYGALGAIPAAWQFANADHTLGLTWMIVTLRSGAQYVWSDRPLPDPSSYYLGWKEPRVIKWGSIRRALSSVNSGQYETTDFSVRLDDNNHVVRDLIDGLLNATVSVYMISDDGRRALETPLTVYRGVIRDVKLAGVLFYDLVIKDPFAEAFSAKATMNLIPRRTVLREDFANCAQTLVTSSAEGYVVDGAVVGGSPEVTIIPLRDGWGCFAEGDEITIGTETFRVTASSMFNELAAGEVGGSIAQGGDDETWIQVDPAVAGTLSDGEAVVQKATHVVEPAQGKRVPFPYGFITDLKVIDGEDNGDGQGPMLYVGDKMLDDGRTYAEFLWAGWACYSPDGKPFAMVYFWNNPLPWGFYFPDINSFSDEADVGGRICCPGYGNWTANGFTDSFVDYNGRRYTVLYLRGLFRDWALGITEAPPNLGGVAFDVNAYGAEDVGDGTGDLILRLAQQYKHAVLNLCPPKGEGYQSGPWLESPTFPDDPSLPMIDEASFDLADAQSEFYVPGGFRGDFIIGANNEAIAARDLIARFNLSGAWQCGFNNQTQFFIDLMNTDLASIALAAGLGWVRDIFTKTFSINPLTKDLYTAIDYVHTQDYLGRMEWRSKTADTADFEVENTTATADFGSKTTFETLQFFMLRGKNTDHDADDYEHGNLTIAAVLVLTLARLSAIQHLPALQTGPAGFEYELAQTLPITHYEGYGTGGWVEEPIRIERTEIDPSEYVTVIEGYQIAPMLDAFAALIRRGRGVAAGVCA